jgi:dephospho-CoA kinase
LLKIISSLRSTGFNKETIIIVGANGTGKTTFARDFETSYPYKFINADEIAKSPQKFIEFAFGSRINFSCNDKKLFDIFIKGVEEK